MSDSKQTVQGESCFAGADERLHTLFISGVRTDDNSIPVTKQDIFHYKYSMTKSQNIFYSNGHWLKLYRVWSWGGAEQCATIGIRRLKPYNEGALRRRQIVAQQVNFQCSNLSLPVCTYKQAFEEGHINLPDLVPCCLGKYKSFWKSTSLFLSVHPKFQHCGPSAVGGCLEKSVS